VRRPFLRSRGAWGAKGRCCTAAVAAMKGGDSALLREEGGDGEMGQWVG
jgi:hypothetical protein